MLYTDCTVTINGEKSVIDRPVVLYRGDKEVEIKFYIVKNTFYQSIVTKTTNVVSDVDASFSQLVIRIPEGEPIFSAVTPVEEDGAIIFKFTAEMIDEVQEVGAYDFQIRLLDENKTSRATIPPVIEGIKIKEPIAIESEPSITNDSNEVNVAQVNEAIITTATQLPAFDEQGNYIETTWTDKMLITDAKLNKIEDGITGVNEKIANLDLSGVDLTGYAKTEDIPTRVSQLTNDANYVNTTQMNEAIANVSGQTVVEPAELDMPKVFFYGNALPTSKDNVNLTMDYISNTAKFSSFVKLKCQGTSSMSYAKKNFTVAMYSDEERATKLKKDFKGWGAQSKFCLKANYVDTTHTRNISGARIAYDMVQSRPDSEFKQQLLQCPRNGLVDGFPIKLYFNGEFYGIYTWNIPKDTWMFNMDKSNPNHIVLCAERNTDGNANAINSCQFRQLWTNGDGQDWSVEVGTMSEDLRTKFNRVIAFVMNATDQEFHDNIGEYFDLYSLLDYYCFSYLTCHLDGLAKNMLMVTYDGVHWGASLYDMDSIYGVSWNGGAYVATNYQCPEQYQEQFSRLWVRIEQCFATELYARYLELRQGALSLSNIVKHVEEIYDVIPDRVFADEKAKWTNLPNVNTNTMTRFRNYMRDRAVYVDAQMQEIGTPQSSVECTGISLDKTELALGAVGSTTSDLGTNLLDGAEWLDGQLNTANGVILTGTDKYTKININTPGKYTLSSTKGYTYKKILMYSIDDIFMYSIGDSNDTDNITLNILEPCIIRISAYPNNLDWDSTALSFIGVNFNEVITNKDVTYTLTASDINVRHVGTQYVFAELYLDREYGDMAIGKYDGNNYKLLYKSSMAQDDKSINSLINMNNLGYTFYGIWNGKSFLYTALPIAYGTTADEILANMTSTTITINSTDELAKLVSTGGTTSERLSAQLTATVTPSNCTQPVVWSVSPEGIVTVDNGLVTAVANGEATVTATCGSQSANCAVTVSGIEEQPGDEPITLTKTLTQGKGFDNTGEVITSQNPNYGICEEYISLIKGNTYTINGCGDWLTLVGYNSDKTFNKFISRGSAGSRTYEFVADCDYIRVGCNITSEATITITGVFSESGGGTDIYATAEYAITEPRTFNGTSDYIDTGIKLFDTAKDFAVFIDYAETGNVPQVNQATIFHCLHEENPYRGLCLMQINVNGSGYMIGGQAVSNNAYLNNIPSLGNHKYLIQFTNGTIASIKTIDTSNNIIDCTLGTTASDNPYAQVTENLLIGCYQDTSGTKGRYWSGTINKFGVWYKQLTEDEINQVFGKSGGGTDTTSANLVFKVDSTSMNTADNTLIDKIAGISATLTGNPTVSGNQIAFTASDTFSFDISSLNLTSSNRTFRIKFTPTTLDSSLRNVIGVGNSNNWRVLTSSYINSTKLILQHGIAGFTNHTVGSPLDNSDVNRLSTTPVTGQEYELVISENTDGNIRWFVDGTLVQDGITTTLDNPLYILNAEGNARFIGSYSLIEVYNGYCNDYTEFTNMVNNV